MPRFRRLTRLGFAYYIALAVAVTIGLVVGGGPGDTIVAIAGVIFALTIFVAFGGVGMAERDALSGRRRLGRSVEEEAERVRRERE